MVILGIDPGTISTGWAMTEGNNVLLSGTFSGMKDMNALLRSVVIADSLTNAINTFQEKYKKPVELAIIEDQYVHVNAKSALILSKMVGMLLYMIHDKFDIPIYLSAPTEIYKILPFNAKQFPNSKAYHKEIAKYVADMYKIELTSIDEAFAILLALSHTDLIPEDDKYV